MPAMKPSAVARCAIANELLRKRNQTLYNKVASPRPTPEHHVNLLSLSIEEVNLSEPPSHRKLQRVEGKRSLPISSAERSGSLETMETQMDAADNTITPEMHWRKSRIWKPTMNRDRMSCTVFAALQRNAQRIAQEASSVQMPADTEEGEVDTSGSQDTQGVGEIVVAVSRQQPCEEENQAFAAFQFPQVQPTDSQPYNPRSLVLQTHLEFSVEGASPASDSTLCEEPVVYSLNQLKGGEEIPTYSTYDDTLRRQAPTAHAVQATEEASTPVPQRRHRRQASTVSTLGVIGTPSMPLTSRAKTPDGLLQFRATSAKNSMAPPRASRHRRKVSLNLPINAPIMRLEAPQQPGFENCAASPHRSIHAQSTSRITMATQQERELEYKHRHIFIGTGSLDDYLEVLEITPTHATTKHAVSKAFVQLSSREQFYARQCSLIPDGWELVSRTTLDVMDVTSVDYVVQLQVKLGSITLRQFLDLIPFDERDEVSAVQVVKAFSAASHLDAKAGDEGGSKARVFRSWIVAQKEGGC